MGSQKSEWKRSVFRLSGIPFRCSTHRQVQALVAKSVEISNEGVKVYSLATTLNPWEMPQTRVATLMFLDIPGFLEQESGSKQWLLTLREDDNPMVLDTHFQGLTPLNDVNEGDHIADCLAISGLASHAFGSWQPRGNDKTFMWIRDQVPGSVPGARVIVYGYESKLAGSQSFQQISDIAIGLISQIKANGGAKEDAKPLVFLAHSLGGIVLKEALSRLAHFPDTSIERRVLNRCRAAIMFGVPNLGMKHQHLLTIVEGNPAEGMVQALSLESGARGYLSELETSFRGISQLHEMTFYWVYETEKSPTFDVSKLAPSSWGR